MTDEKKTAASGKLRERMKRLGREFGLREADQAETLVEARELVTQLRVLVAEAVEVFTQSLFESGAKHLEANLEIAISEIQLDDKHVRALGFHVVRGRHKICVVAKTKGSVTLVGPFHIGKQEGPCQRLPFPSDADSQAILAETLLELLEAFFKEAMTT